IPARPAAPGVTAMRRLLAACVVLALISAARAADDPLRLVPRQADLALRVDSPRKLVEAVLATDAVRELGQFAAVREAFQTTGARRVANLIAYYEKDLGAPWPELLGRLAGGGVVLTTKFERGGQAPALLVVQGTDEELLKRAMRLVLG